MWESIFAFVFVSIIGFLLYHRIRRSPENGKVKVTDKYGFLINELSGGRPRFQKKAARFVKFDFKKGRDQYVYLLTETEGNLSVVWTIESQMYGRRGKEWLFAQDLDQERMSGMIKADVQAYLKNIHNT